LPCPRLAWFGTIMDTLTPRTVVEFSTSTGKGFGASRCIAPLIVAKPNKSIKRHYQWILFLGHVQERMADDKRMVFRGVERLFEISVNQRAQRTIIRPDVLYIMLRRSRQGLHGRL